MTNLDTERQLLADVAASPDQDAPRLAYAAWLDVQGQTPRARLIRVQCEQDKLQAEARALIDRHGEEWGEDLRELGAVRWAFHRGFPEELTIPAPDYLAHHAAIAAVTPVTRLHLSHADDALLGRLAVTPSLSNLRSLDVGRNEGGFTAAGVRALATSPHLHRLRELGLQSRSIGAAGVHHLAAAPFVKNLSRLELRDPNFEQTEGQFSKIVGALDPTRVREFRWNDQVYTADSLVFQVARPTGTGPAEGLRR